MATKTAKQKPAAKEKALTKTEKAAAKMAYDEGRTAHETGNLRGTCLHDEPHLREAWFRGWDESNNTNEAENEPLPMERDEVQKAEKNADGLDASENGINPHMQNGHDFADPLVIARAETLAALMLAFDNVGVAIDETQWRALSEADQNIAARWLNTRRNGTKSPVPTAIQIYANEELKAEIAPYLDDQQRLRRVIMRCTFDKPSPTKPESDEGEEKIKMTLKVPVSELSASTANDLFGWRRARVEFGLREVHTWDQVELPCTKQTVSFVADISGFSRNRTHWKFAALVPVRELSISDAFDVYWKSNGSCRVESMGDIPKNDRDDSENPELDDRDDDEPDEVRQPSLFDNAESDGRDTPEDQPLEFLIPVLSKDAFSSAYAWRKSNRWYSVVELNVGLEDSDGPQHEIGNHLHFVIAGDGSASLVAAIEKDLGSVIDEAFRRGIHANVINDLRDELNRLSKGGQPHPMPEGDSEGI